MADFTEEMLEVVDSIPESVFELNASQGRSLYLYPVTKAYIFAESGVQDLGNPIEINLWARALNKPLTKGLIEAKLRCNLIRS